MRVGILADFNLAVVIDRQTAKYNSPPYFPAIRLYVCLVAMPCAFLWYPLTLWLAKLVCMHPSEQVTCSDNSGHAILLSLVPRFCIIVL